MKQKKKKTSKKPRTPSASLPSEPGLPGEDRASVAVTVAWALTMLAAAFSVVLAPVVFIYAKAILKGQAPLISLASDALFYIAVFTGIGSIGLLPVVNRVRPDSPPRAIQITAVILGFSWLIVGLMRAFWTA